MSAGLDRISLTERVRQARERDPSGLRRWWVYQAERFPLLAHGPLILAFSFCCVSLSRTLRQQEGWPPAFQVTVAFVSCLLLFLQLRIADEFKDLEEDTRFRPYRAVPRGLVSLRELAWLFGIAAAVQLLLTLLLDPRLVLLLLVTWAYLGAMTREFWVREWLSARPILYMASHMLIMPLIDLYATSADWLPAGHGGPPVGLLAFLAASYTNGVVIELGRKLRSPADEEPGVQTYTALWGRPTAVGGWLGAQLLTAMFALQVARQTGSEGLTSAILGEALLFSALGAAAFLSDPRPRRGKWLEGCSALWTLALYGALGLAPHLAGGQP